MRVRRGIQKPYWSRVVVGLSVALLITGSGPLTCRMTRASSEKNSGSPTWVQARELLGNAWAMPAKIEPLPVPLPVGWTEQDLPENFWWVIGRWLGDGWTAGEGKRVFICCANKEGPELEAALAGTTWDWRKTVGPRTHRFSVSTPELRLWLNEHFHAGARNKEIPPWLYGAPTSIREAFLAGYVSADGWQPNEGTAKASTSVHLGSRLLATSLRILVASLGFAPVSYTSTQKPSTIRGRPVVGKGAFRVDWQHSHPGDSKTQSWNDGEHLWGEVKSLTLDEEVVPVYDLEVEEDHSFVADAFVVHNCQNIALTSAEAGTWEVTYTWGKVPPEAARFAATVLSAELVKACLGDSGCRIPAGAVTVQRQGITFDFSLTDGKTGLYEVDLAIAALNPHGVKRRARVYSPDDFQWARTTTGS